MSTGEIYTIFHEIMQTRIVSDMLKYSKIQMMRKLPGIRYAIDEYSTIPADDRKIFFQLLNQMYEDYNGKKIYLSAAKKVMKDGLLNEYDVIFSFEDPSELTYVKEEDIARIAEDY